MRASKMKHWGITVPPTVSAYTYLLKILKHLLAHTMLIDRYWYLICATTFIWLAPILTFDTRPYFYLTRAHDDICLGRQVQQLDLEVLKAANPDLVVDSFAEVDWLSTHSHSKLSTYSHFQHRSQLYNTTIQLCLPTFFTLTRTCDEQAGKTLRKRADDAKVCPLMTPLSPRMTTPPPHTHTSSPNTGTNIKLPRVLIFDSPHSYLTGINRSKVMRHWQWLRVLEE